MMLWTARHPGSRRQQLRVRRRQEDRRQRRAGPRRAPDQPAAGRDRQRIFSDYARGVSPRAIAKQLNREGVPSPSGKGWGPSTIHGNWQRGTGILNNELYIGRQVWNRLRFIKDPQTGKRISRLNPQSEWVTHDVPELRMIDQDLWDQVKARQGAMQGNRSRRQRARLLGPAPPAISVHRPDAVWGL